MAEAVCNSLCFSKLLLSHFLTAVHTEVQAAAGILLEKHLPEKKTFSFELCWLTSCHKLHLKKNLIFIFFLVAAAATNRFLLRNLTQDCGDDCTSVDCGEGSRQGSKHKETQRPCELRSFLGEGLKFVQNGLTHSWVEMDQIHKLTLFTKSSQ